MTPQRKILGCHRVTGLWKCSNQNPLDSRPKMGMRKMSEHKHGEMNIEVQQKTFNGFVKFSAWSVVVIIGILLFMAMVNG